MSVIIILLYFLLPALFLALGTRFSFINKIGVVVFCYVFGLILGNTGMMPAEFLEPQEGSMNLPGLLMGVMLLLGIPLVLISENIVKWISKAKLTFLSLMLGVVSVIIMVFVGFFLFRNHIPDSAKIGGMLIGVYTGGTPNLAAIAQGLGVDEDQYILTHTVDLALGALVLLFLITGAQKFFLLYLRPYKSTGKYTDAESEEMASEFDSYKGFFNKKNRGDILKSFAIAVAIFLIGYGFSTLFVDPNPSGSSVKKETSDVVAILTVTTLGLLLSLVPSINRIKKSFQLGMYFIYVFCVIVASKANLQDIFNPESWEMLLYTSAYVAMAMIGSLFLHSLLSWIFRINADDFIMTSTALANSPPFVPVVAAALKNKEVMIPGMIIGVIGYAIGNYLGIIVAKILEMF
jgi:uncharacterized membrane protein